MSVYSYNWEILDNPEVADVIDKAARKVAFRFHLDFEELRQEARLLVANPAVDLAQVVDSRVSCSTDCSRT